MNEKQSIGVYDSGLGGLTVLAALKKQYPNESIVYLGDTARLPYGNKSPETVVQYALNGARELMKKANLKFLVLACNTMTAHALKTLQKELKIPVVGVIEPGVLEVIRRPEIKSLAVLATSGTILARAYEDALMAHDFHGEIYSLACPLFVPLVEEGLVEGELAEHIVQHYLQQLPKVPDAVILGCTHYPLLLPVLSKALPSKTIWIDSGSALAKTHLPIETSQTQKGSIHYLVTDRPKNFQTLASLFLGAPVLESQVELINIGV